MRDCHFGSEKGGGLVKFFLIVQIIKGIFKTVSHKNF